ncbi:MAG: hypothetical protein MJ158_04095 [Alphaproteobacteria bacterium]|nr:hypothetical protein [Alphaproteobacteria bacterium]
MVLYSYNTNGIEMNDLQIKASTHFQEYLDMAQSGKQYIGIPYNRLSTAEWEKLNANILHTGIILVPKIKSSDGGKYMVFTPFSRMLSNKFDEYIDLVKQTNKMVDFPAHILTASQWNVLKDMLAVKGIAFKLVGDKMRMMTINKSKKMALNYGLNMLEQKLFEVIQERYPNLSDDTISRIAKADNQFSMYDALRYAKTPYNSSERDFTEALRYALNTASKQLGEFPALAKWKPSKPELDELGTNINPQITMFGYQSWTWAREYSGAHNPIKNPHHPHGFHVSLNVNITPELLKSLDELVAKDMGRHIQYYKFPKLSDFKEAKTRHDPVTIYMYSRDDNTEQEIVKRVAPFVRENDGLIGYLLGTGVDINEEMPAGSDKSVGQDFAQKVYALKERLRSRY